MKRFLWRVSLLVLIAGSANAALISRLSGAAYYDDVLDITWLADANAIAGTIYDDGSSSFPGSTTDGLTSWASAQLWIASLNAEGGGAGHLGANDWRLPLTLQPDATCSHQYAPGQNYAFGCTGSEMGHLYNVDGVTYSSPGPFSNVQPGRHWSGTEYAPDSATLAWTLRFDDGYQSRYSKGENFNAWAVRPGDIGAVPEPGTLWLFGTGLVALGAKLARRVRHAATGA